MQTDAERIAALEEQVRLLRLVADTTRAQLADYALAVDVLGRLATFVDEPSVSGAIVDLFTLLFAPESVHLHVEEGHAFAKVTGHASIAPSLPLPEGQYAVTGNGTGFVVRLEHDGQPVAVVEVVGLAHPGFCDRYVNTALCIAPVCAMMLVHARALRGMLPICSYCKKIRGSEGSWHRLEEYISEHSEALFSHGICPACLDAVERDLR